MQPVSAMALKEWAAVCAALEAGRQTIVMRKGGVSEGPRGFQPDHAAFWLLPTFFHERPAAIAAGDLPFFEAADRSPPPAGQLRISLFALVHGTFLLTEESQLDKLTELQILGPATLAERFRYRQPGLFVLALRIYRLAAPIELAAWPELAGCHSWVDLPQAFSTVDLQPVLEADSFARQLAEVELACQ